MSFVPDNTWGKLANGSSAPGPSTTLTRVPLKPLQFHFHSTCEHVLDGDTCPLEFHLVTQVDTTTGAPVPAVCKTAPCLAVFGVMLKLNPDPAVKGHPLIELITANIPEEVGVEHATKTGKSLNLTDFLPQNKDYVHYGGSLTIPGCGQGVAWHGEDECMRAQPARLPQQRVCAVGKRGHTCLDCATADTLDADHLLFPWRCSVHSATRPVVGGTTGQISVGAGNCGGGAAAGVVPDAASWKGSQRK